ncbi:MAG: hypothetical protein FWF92_04625 [Oscillospiraceae bacterium]|nr:hypothetical protein [Oscillospiraceae bacterium]
MKQMIEIASICTVSALMIIFASLYFIGTKKRKNLNNAIKGSFDPELIEQIQIINAQLDLMFELSPIFIVCYDYGRNFFYMSENGKMQLGYNQNQFQSNNTNETDQKKFENLIHEDYISLYEEVTNFEDIRKHEIADSPYIIKIKNIETNIYNEYIIRVKPIYDEDGINKALVAAFINTEYIKQK